jgi:UPF0755 protein
VKKFALFVLFVMLVAAGAGVWFYQGVGRPFKGYEGAEQFVEIPQGSGSTAIATRLAQAGVVRDVNSFRLALWLTGAGRRLQAGEYRFDQPLSPKQVAEKIARGDVYVRQSPARAEDEGATARCVRPWFRRRGRTQRGRTTLRTRERRTGGEGSL